ncbi:NucA/NucB deoxyribonuclease domain-containing protein [Avibacterium avium]|uniref:NucA/NucB deoxyribonuclease domain-containing protein n=1 Tax=Avibacterium avium TaxID=751 RepID=UPI003BF8A78B
MQIDNRRYAELFANDFYRVNEALIDKDPVTIQKEAFANEVAKFKHTRPEDEYIWISNSIDLGWLGEYPGWGKAIKGLGNYATKVPKTINANSKLPVVGNATGYGDIKVNGIITLSKAKYPETATHINDAINKGHPNILTIDRKGAVKRRREALSNIPIKKGFDRDEYPPAMFAEGGKNSSIRYISPSDNRGAGSCIGIQCREFNDGDKIKIEIKE